MMEKKSISVIVPFFRGGKYVDSLIGSIEEQTLYPDEVIFVDDGRGVDVELLIEKVLSSRISNISIFLSCVKNSGPAYARNLGLSVASGKYISFLDCDDTWLPGFLSEMFSFATENNFALIATGAFFHVEGRRVCELRMPKKLTFFQLVQTCPLLVPAVFVDRDLVGGFYFPNVKHEDYALWLTLAKKYDFFCIDKPLVVINREVGSVSSNKFKAIKWQWHVLRNFTELGFFSRAICFFVYAFNAILKRRLRIYRPFFVF